MRKFIRQLQLFGFASGIALAAVIYLACAIVFFEDARADEAEPTTADIGYWVYRYEGDSRSNYNESIEVLRDAIQVWAWTRARQELFPTSAMKDIDYQQLNEQATKLLVCGSGDGSWYDTASVFANWLEAKKIEDTTGFSVIVFMFAENLCEYQTEQGKEKT